MIMKLLENILLVSSLLFLVACSDSKRSNEEETFTVNGVTFTMINVKGGSFTMGATPDQWTDGEAWKKQTTENYYNGYALPTHDVKLSDFAIGQTEVTQELWQAVMGKNPSYCNGQREWETDFGTNLKRPVDNVSWNDCQDFIKKLNTLTSKSFRLPTEAEWEFAARGGNMSKGFKYAGSDNIVDVVWFEGNAASPAIDRSSPDFGTHTVATKAPNELGLYDMCGNVLEWCQDWYGDYSEDSQKNPTGPKSGELRVLRGGSWNYSAEICRVSRRCFGPDTIGLNITGLRLAL